MIVDSSALIAIIYDEEDAPTLVASLKADTKDRFLSTANYLEAGIVVDGRRHDDQRDRLDELLADQEIRLVAVTLDQAKIARQAYRVYGKGSGHPAQLNFGDCFAYALAKDRDEPLLFKGNDFSQTDVRQAL